MTNEEIEIIKIVFQSYLNIVKILKKPNYVSEEVVTEVRDKLIKALEQQRWIPIKTRPLTEEEKEHYISIGWSEDSLEFIYNCPLPDDGQEVLITDSMGNVELDTFYSDDGCYFENNCDADEVIAWMPLPQPYKESDKEWD